jgi:hypothetical protein
MDFFVVATGNFRLLYVWFALDYSRRRVLSFDVTASPTASWLSQQLHGTFSGAECDGALWCTSFALSPPKPELPRHTNI